MKYISICLLILAMVFSCKKDEPVVDQAQADEDLIVKYIADNNLAATATGTGLYYVINTIGTGLQASASSTVTVAYKGYFTDGSVFDESNSAGISFALDGVIEGWIEGIPYYKEGGNGILLIPSALGYGNQDRNGIPANSVLIFDVSLIDVSN